MAIKDVIDTLTGAIPAAPDMAALRAPVSDRVGQTRALLPRLQPGQPTSDWVSLDPDGRVAFGPTRPDGQPIVIGGQGITFWSMEAFPRILDAFEAALNSGELDDQLADGTPAGKSLAVERLTGRA